VVGRANWPQWGEWESSEAKWEKKKKRECGFGLVLGGYSWDFIV